MILWRNWGGWHAFSVFFCFEQESLQNRVCRPFLFLTTGNSKSDRSLKRLWIALKSKTTIEKTTRHWSQLCLLQKLSKFRLKCLLTFFPRQALCNIKNTSTCWKMRVMFCVTKRDRYVTLDDGSNYVTFHELSSSQRELGLPVPHIVLRLKQVNFKAQFLDLKDPLVDQGSLQNRWNFLRILGK